MMGSKKSRLSPVALGVGFGVACALSMLIVLWAGWFGGYGKTLTDMWASVYPGVSATLSGGFVGAVWGFFDGFVFGLISGIVYNMCMGCCSRCNCGCCNSGTCEPKK